MSSVSSPSSLNTPKKITIFGEVLFDCFQKDSREEQVLGGAPFNICWHLQALGDQPIFISRLGMDKLGETILHQALLWGISADNIQLDRKHATGQVQVTLVEDEPEYEIKEGAAYDFIEARAVNCDAQPSILYHGSLALRSDYAKQQFERLVAEGNWQIFLDVNLRAPWWDQTSLFAWIRQARWVKLNIDELIELGFTAPELEQAMLAFQQEFGCEQVIVTQGAEGVSALTAEGFFSAKPEKIQNFVDTVGAGDAFTAVYIHGLMAQWPIQKTLSAAQAFASKVIGIRGATPQEKSFYELES